MARSLGIVKVTIWEPESEFRLLSKEAQRAYLLLLSQPQINNCGVLPYTPERWARMAADDTTADVETAIAELVEHRFVLVDYDPGELLVRTFVKHDRIASQPKLVKAAQREFQHIESDSIRDVLRRAHPELFSRQAIVAGHVLEGVSLPLSEGVTVPLSEGVSLGVREGVSEPLGARATRVGAVPSPYPNPPPLAPAAENLTRSSSRDAAPANDSNQSTAAAADARDEPPRESEIREAVATLRSADAESFDELYPLASTVSRAAFGEALEKVEQRRERGKVVNDVGLLVDLLRKAQKSARRTAATTTVSETPPAEPIERLAVSEVVERQAEHLARSGHSWKRVEQTITELLEARAVTEDERVGLIDRAADAYRSSSEAETPA